MVGDFASAIIFVCGMLTWVLLLTSVAAYAAYCMVTVVTDTAAGEDVVRWPGDAMIDWIGQSIRVGITFATLMIPVGFYLRFFGGSFYPDNPAGGAVVLTAAWMWLAFPIGLLCSMGSGQPFAILHPTVLRGLVLVVPWVVVFYILSALVCTVCLLLWVLALPGGVSPLIPVAAIASSAGLLIYARLLGRLGGLTQYAKPRHRSRSRPAGKLKPKLRKRIKVTDPWAEPAEPAEPEPEPEAEAKPLYQAVQIQAPPPKPPARVEEEDEFAPPTPYGVNGDPLCRPPEFELLEGTPFLDVKLKAAKPTTEAPAPRPPHFVDDEDNIGGIQLAAPDPVLDGVRPSMDVAPSTVEMRLMEQREEAPPPDYPMFSGVFEFPFYPTSLRALFVLTVGFLALGTGFAVLMVFFPGR
jgi:hypothetical protein